MKTRQRKADPAELAAQIVQHEVPQKPSSSVESLPLVVNVPNEKEPDKKELEAPLVVAPQTSSVAQREKRGAREVSKEDILARLAAGGLLHLAEDMRSRSKDFKTFLRDADVQTAAWRALERMMRQGSFGVVERAAPIFLGDEWRTEDAPLRTLAREYILQTLVAEYRGDAGSRLPVAVLQKKAEAFGFDWNTLEQEARAQVPKKTKKIKK